MMDDAFGHWLAGFADGEACFAINRVTSTHGNPNRLYWPYCVFQISLRADDAGVLVMIRDTLGFGNVGYQNPAKDRPSIMLACRYSVTRKADCAKLVDLFRKYPLRAKKAAQFAVWAEAVEAMAQESRSVEAMEPYRERLRNLREWIGPDDISDAIRNNPVSIRGHNLHQSKHTV